MDPHWKSTALALGVAFLACPILARLAPALRLMDVPNHPRKTQKKATPRVGGLAILLGVTAALLLDDSHLHLNIWLGVAGMGVAGLLDDWLDLRAGPKFLLQIAVASFLWWSGIRVTFFIPSAVAGYGFTVLWFVWVVNAVNYTDNSNGLCGGMGAIILGGLAFINFSQGDGESAQKGWSALLMVGALLGFLAWNFPSGRVFLGDHGSHMVGAAIAAMIMDTTFVRLSQHGSPWAMAAVPLLVAVPLVDFLQVSVGRWRRGEPIWQADQNHLAHLLVRNGRRTSMQAVVLLWLATLGGVALAVGICFFGSTHT